MINPITMDHASNRVNPSTYGFIKTDVILETLGRHGWHTVETKVSKTRQDNDGFQRHLVTLENDQFPAIGGIRPRVSMLNSHDCTTAYKLFMGFLRYACLNNNLIGDGLFNFRVIHNANAMMRLHEGLEIAAQRLPLMLERVEALRNTKLDESQRIQYVKDCFDARLANVKHLERVSYNARPRRAADLELDAFTVYQRIQEYLVKGGIEYTYLTPVKGDDACPVEFDRRKGTTRSIGSIAASVKLNQLAWDKINALVA